jgi:hypothetical protein
LRAFQNAHTTILLLNRALDVGFGQNCCARKTKSSTFRFPSTEDTFHFCLGYRQVPIFLVGVLPYVLQSAQPAKLLPVTGKLEDRIQQLCAKVKATEDDEELYRLCEELRLALKEHVGQLREQVAEYRRAAKTNARKKGR